MGRREFFLPLEKISYCFYPSFYFRSTGCTVRTSWSFSSCRSRNWTMGTVVTAEFKKARNQNTCHLTPQFFLFLRFENPATQRGPQFSRSRNWTMGIVDLGGSILKHACCVMATGCKKAPRFRVSGLLRCTNIYPSTARGDHAKKKV